MIAIAAATLISGQAAIAATNGPGHAPTYEEVQKTARDFGLVDPVADQTPVLADVQNPATGVEQTETQGGSPATDPGGFPTRSVIIGVAVGAGVVLVIASFALLGGRRRDHPVST